MFTIVNEVRNDSVTTTRHLLFPDGKTIGRKVIRKKVSDKAIKTCFGNPTISYQYLVKMRNIIREQLDRYVSYFSYNPMAKSEDVISLVRDNKSSSLFENDFMYLIEMNPHDAFIEINNILMERSNNSVQCSSHEIEEILNDDGPDCDQSHALFDISMKRTFKSMTIKSYDVIGEKEEEQWLRSCNEGITLQDKNDSFVGLLGLAPECSLEVITNYIRKHHYNLYNRLSAISMEIFSQTRLIEYLQIVHERRWRFHLELLRNSSCTAEQALRKINDITENPPDVSGCQTWLKELIYKGYPDYAYEKIREIFLLANAQTKDCAVCFC